MQRHFPIFVVILGMLLLACTFSIEAAEAKGKIPITTSSKEARELYLKGLDFADKLRAHEALGYFQKAVAADPSMAIGYLNLALVEPAAKDFFADLNKAVALTNKVSGGERLWVLGVQAGANGQPKQQLEYYEKLVAAYPNDERAHTLLAGSYFGLQDWEKAVSEYKKSAQINPQFSPAYNLMGYAYRFLERYKEAEDSFQKYIELIPDDPNPYDSYAELLMRIGRYDESIKNYQKALSVDPHFVASHIGISNNYNFKGEYDKARTQLQKLYDSARDDGERRAALFAMTVSYLDEGNVPKAIEKQQAMYKLAEQIQDAAAMAGDLNTIGTILLESDRPDDAKENFDRSLRIISKSNLSREVQQNAMRIHLFNLSTVTLQKKRTAEAKVNAQEFQKEAEASGNRFLIWLAHELKGRIALEEKNFDVALAELQKSNLLNSQNLYRIALAFEGKGDQSKALETYKRVADFNALNNLNYSFVRTASRKKSSAS